MTICTGSVRDGSPGQTGPEPGYSGATGPGGGLRARRVSGRPKGCKLAHTLLSTVGAQLEKAEVGPTSGPAWRLIHLGVGVMGAPVFGSMFGDSGVYGFSEEGFRSAQNM